MHILNANRCGKKKRWQPDSDSFFFLHLFFGSNIIMCKVRFNIGVSQSSEACNRVLLHTFSFDLPVQFLASIL